MHRLRLKRRPRAAFLLLAFALFGLACITTAAADEITQYFPVTVSGEPPAKRESGWRITWHVYPPARKKVATHLYGGSSVWEIRSIDFMKGYRPDGSEDWVRVLNRLAMAEMYVPYHDGKTEFFDITQFEFPMIRARRDFLPRSGITSAKLHEDGYIISEVTDDHVRWMDNNDRNKVQRGQVLNLWGTLFSGNYRYILRYSFSDDGTISVRVGGTAENFFDFYDEAHGGKQDLATHIHMAAWRMEFNLGNPDNVILEMIERDTDKTGKPATRVRPFNGGREGGEIWDPTKFSVLRVSSGQTKNRADPPRNIAYTLRAVRTGSVRTRRAFTSRDFWVSRLQPDSRTRTDRGPEFRFIDVPDNVSVNPEPINGKAVAIWHQTGLNHIVRSEDYGVTGRKEYGAAIAAWTGFDLVPSNLWHQTPFLQRREEPPRDPRPPHGPQHGR